MSQRPSAAAGVGPTRKDPVLDDDHLDVSGEARPLGHHVTHGLQSGHHRRHEPVPLVLDLIGQVLSPTGTSLLPLPS